MTKGWKNQFYQKCTLETAKNSLLISYFVFSPNAGKCGKNAARITTNTDTFYAVPISELV